MDLETDQLAALLAADLDRHYEQLVSRYWHQLSLFVLRRIRHYQDTEDIIQETFMRAYLSLERYPYEQILTLKLRPWLYKIAWSVYCNTSGRNHFQLMVPLEATDEGWSIELEDEEENQPEVLYEKLEQRRELENLIDSLPPHFRELISLYYFEELTQKEVAEILNIPLGTVKVYIHRGIRLLRKKLAEQAATRVG
jgi:RNA polymerase sigma-70 factor (ECF subfamily)